MPRPVKWRVEAEDKASRNLRKVKESFKEVTTSAGALSPKLGDVTSKLDALGSSSSKFGIAGGFVVAGIAALTAGLASAIAAGQEYEQAMLKLEGVQRATGQASGFTAEQLNNLAESLERNTLTSLPAARETVAALSSFTNIVGSRFKEALTLGQDLATVFGGDLRTQTLKLARALNDPVTEMNAFTAEGIRFTAEQRNLITVLQQSGRLLDAQDVILRKLRSTVGGAGGSEGGGLAGGVDTLAGNWARLNEQIAQHGVIDLATIAVGKLADAVQFLNDVTRPASQEETLSDLVGRRSRVLSRIRQVEQDVASSGVGELPGGMGPRRHLEGMRREVEQLNAAIGELTRTRATAAAQAAAAGRAAESRVRTEQEGLARRNFQASLVDQATRSSIALEAERGRAAKRFADQAAAAAKRQQDQIEGVIESLRTERDTFEMTREQIAAYRLEKMGADEATVNLSKSLGDEIAQLRRAREEREETKRQFEALAEAQLRQRESVESSIQALEQQVDMLGMSADQAERYQLHIEGATAADLERARALQDALGADRAMRDRLEEAQDAARELGLEFSSAFEDAVVKGQDLRSVLQGLEQDILRIATRRLVTEPLIGAVSGLIGNLPVFGAGGGGAAAGSFRAAQDVGLSALTKSEPAPVNITVNMLSAGGFGPGAPTEGQAMADAMAKAARHVRRNR